MKKLIYIALLSITVFSCTKKYDTVYRDYSYGDDSLQTLDLYLPQDYGDKTDILVLVHGGGWHEGDKSDFDGWFDYLKEQNKNYAIINLNYRLATDGKVPLPMQTDDIHSAIEKVKKDFRLPWGNIAMIGVSAGAHLSMLYAYKYDTDNEIKAVVSIVGPTDFTDTTWRNVYPYTWVFASFEQIFARQYSTDSDYYRSISPYYIVTENSPATALFYGKIDSIVPYTQGEKMYLKLQDLGVKTEYHLYEQSGHGFTADDALDCFLKSIEFAEENME